MSGPLATILHRDALRLLADTRTFERGVAYFTQGHVAKLERRETSLEATVRGTVSSDTYDVRIWIRDNALAFSCSCPMGTDGHFCKHAVAVGLTWLDRAMNATGSSRSRDASPVVERWLAARTELSDLRHRLDALDKNTLVDLIVREAATNAQLRAKLGGG